ncbi:RIBOSOMAL RNA PROCESSING PROTEIN 7-RELATED [Salix koriyanagi]|uniref:RIBOSOMAL RNA PROCESSING PROTEIN 7-RELATED n=1 Tax=Salix koriyanagi TaxID=2511006 RepID=A0A9Q0VQ43_9ROSI|nr:RIBOSOMAL RNA PROCESSING PROTEIN 7-RELATED [Salix koriyanagi]
MEGIKVNKSTEKKKRRNKDGRNNVDGGDIIWISKEDDETKAEGEKKRNKLRKKKKTEVGSKIMLCYAEFHLENITLLSLCVVSWCTSHSSEGETNQDEAYCISSGDEDYSKGMKKWLTDYHQSRPGLKVLQQRLDEFIIAHEEKLDQERKEREAQAAEGGWTVVKHHKGRKKTTDSESGITVGSVAPAAMENQTKKKPKEVGLEFYRFQKREAQKSEILALRSKFEEDRKRIQQLRAARKFRPY